MGAKIDQQSIKKGSQDGKVSWHRFFVVFGGFLEASWGGKWSQDRPKKASKKRWKKESHQDGQKIEKRPNNDSRPEGSKAPGRSPPLRRDSPLGVPQRSARPFKSSQVLSRPLKESKIISSDFKLSQVVSSHLKSSYLKLSRIKTAVWSLTLVSVLCWINPSIPQAKENKAYQQIKARQSKLWKSNAMP